MRRTAIQVTTVTGLVLGAGLAWLMLAGPVPPLEQPAADPGQAGNAAAASATESRPAPGSSPSADSAPASPARPLEQDNAVAGSYPGRTLGSMSPGELAQFYRFHRLSQEGRWLKVNGEALAVLEDMAQDRPLEEIEQAVGHIREAAAGQLAPHAADQFADLVPEYVDYSRRLDALDEERNRLGLTPDDVDEAGALTALQDRVFGADDAEGLFGQRRAAMALMEKHGEQYAGHDGPLTEEETRQMEEEYRALE